MGRAQEQPRLGQGDAALNADPRWFPRPESLSDLEIVAPAGGLDPEALFGLLAAGDAAEWRHKVGVAGRADGSGKASTRLLASGGWIFKTNIAELDASRDALRARLLAERQRGTRAGVWHPSKRWAMLRTPEGWLPLGICRELRTLRSFEHLEDRLRGWTEMLAMGIDAHHVSGLGLDLNPANFAVERDGGELYYLDDEFYPTFEPRQVAYAMAARIPEEPGVPAETWRDFARRVRDVLVARGHGPAQLEHLVDELLGYPLAEAFDPIRAELVKAFRAAPAKRAVGSSGDRVCVIADVHANLPALDAVLEAARERGATSFLFLGDAVGYGPHPRECVQRIAELAEGGRATLIRGNHDHAIATGKLETGMNSLARRTAEWTLDRLGRAEVEWLAALPTEHRADDWMAVHGAPRDPHRFFAYVYELTYEENLAHLGKEGVALCFHGHTHVPLVHVALPSGPAKLRPAREVRLLPGRPCLVNPGSVGQPRDGDPRASFAIWEPAGSQMTFERVTYRIDRTLRDIEKAGLPIELLARLQQGT